MLGPEPHSFYDAANKCGLGYKNPCYLKKAIAQNLKLYPATFLSDNNVHASIHDYEETLEDAEKSRLKMQDFQKYEKEFTKEVKEMYDIFESIERELEETSYKNDNFTAEYDRLLEATLAYYVKNCFIQSFVEIENENFRDEIERILMEPNMSK
ncbi:hypothetical protein Tco_0667186 [Tanacetum coccineum]